MQSIREIPNIKNATIFCNSLVNGFPKGSVPARIVEHVKIRGRSQKGFGRVLWTLVLFIDDDPLRVAGEWIEFELKEALRGGRAHSSAGSEAS